MTGAVDTSREACEAMCDWRSPFTSVQHRKEAFALIRALRAALDAAERERDENHAAVTIWRRRYYEADTSSYARGVRDAAAKFAGGVEPIDPRGAILAPLPATEKEKNDAE